MRALPVLAAVLLLSPPPLPLGSAAAAVPDRSDLLAASAVLHGWDRRRELAWAAGDARALRRLYAAGSAAGDADVRLLRAYAARGLVVRRIVTQVFALDVLDHDAGRLTLRVLDRVAGGEVDDGTRVAPLDVTRPAVRRVQLVRSAGAWRVASVTPGRP